MMDLIAMDKKVTPGSAIKALQEASEKICEEEYLKMKDAFILYAIGTTMGERKDNEQ